jgi:hypothetical protein
MHILVKLIPFFLLAGRFPDIHKTIFKICQLLAFHSEKKSVQIQKNMLIKKWKFHSHF